MCTELTLAPLLILLSPLIRWLAAGGVGLLLWVLYPVLAGMLCRRMLLRQEKLAPEVRLQRFRTAQRYSSFVLLGLVYVTVTLWERLRVSAVVHSTADLNLLFGPLSKLLFGRLPLLPLLLTLWFWTDLTWKCVGLPLEREAELTSPHSLGWLRRRADLTVDVLALGAGLFWIGTDLWPGRRSFHFDPALLLPLALILVPVLVLGFFAPTLLSQRRIAAAAKPFQLPREPGPLREALPALAEKLEQELAQEQPAAAAGNRAAVVSYEIDSAYRGVLASLEPERRVLLSAAMLLGNDVDARYATLQSLSTLLLLIVAAGTGVIILVTMHQPNGSGQAALMIGLGLCLVLGPACNRFALRVRQRGLDEVDNLMLQVVDDPQRYLDVLRQLDAVDTVQRALFPGTPAAMLHAARRERLARRLGLE